MTGPIQSIKTYFKSRQLLGYSLFLFFMGGGLKLFSLFREILIANYYGTSLFKDGFVALIALFSIFFAPLMEAMIVSVPKYLKEQQQSNFIVFLTSILICISLLLSGILYWIAPHLIQLIYGNLEPKSIQVVYNYLIYGLIFVNVQLWIQLISQFFYATNAYWNAELKSVVISLIVIACITFKWTLFGIDPLIMGHVLGVLSVLIIMIIQLLRHKLIIIHDIKDMTKTQLIEWTQWLYQHFFPILFVLGISMASLFSIQYVMSSFGTSILSANDYALRLYTLLIILVFMPIITPLYTLISSEDMQIKNTLNRFHHILKYISILFALIFIGTYFFSEWGIKLLFQRGEFNNHSTQLTSKLFILYMAGLIFDVIRRIFFRIFLVFQKTTFLIWSALLSNIIFCIALFLGKKWFNSFLIVPIFLILINIIFVLIEYTYLKRSIATKR